MTLHPRAIAFLIGLAGVGGAAAPNAVRPWSSPDGRVRLLRPADIAPTRTQAPAGTLMGPGWRLIWDATDPMPGTVLLRLSLSVKPIGLQTRRAEYLQVGRSRAPEVVRTCLTYGLDGGGEPGRRPDRVIGGRRFAVWMNSDAGMSQEIEATDLRTIADGACYAVERFSYGDAASDPDPTVTEPQQSGAARLDAALATLRIGPPAPAGARTR